MKEKAEQLLKATGWAILFGIAGLLGLLKGRYLGGAVDAARRE
jgi:hypothetical protein